MSVYVNRLLNLKKIKVIGFDMDYTLVRYRTLRFEALTHKLACEKLVEVMGYPPEAGELEFDIKRSIGGLVIDRRNGYLLKLSRFGKVKISYFGLDPVDFRKQREIYGDLAIDLGDPDYRSLDTAFAISQGVLFSQLVQLKKEGIFLPDYAGLSDDVIRAIDCVHRDGSLKGILTSHFDEYVIPDPETAALLERLKHYGKTLMIITNSDYLYTRKLLDYSLNPYLKEHQRWEDLFQVVITLADKPTFFRQASRFLKITDAEGHMTNWEGKVNTGIFQGGGFQKLQDDLGVQGREILYLGDHIYGDVVSIKKQCGWRTALVLEDLEKEVEGLKKAAPLQSEIDELLREKEACDQEIYRLDMLRHEGERTSRKRLDRLFVESERLNSRISELLREYRTFFNPFWGEILRAGSNESRFADQVERYACIYMTKVSDLYAYSPKTYFRPARRLLPHEHLED